MDIEKVREFKSDLLELINKVEARHNVTMQHIALIGYREADGKKLTDDLDIVFTFNKPAAAAKKKIKK